MKYEELRVQRLERERLLEDALWKEMTDPVATEDKPDLNRDTRPCSTWQVLIPIRLPVSSQIKQEWDQLDETANLDICIEAARDEKQAIAFAVDLARTMMKDATCIDWSMDEIRVRWCGWYLPDE